MASSSTGDGPGPSPSSARIPGRRRSGPSFLARLARIRGRLLGTELVVPRRAMDSRAYAEGSGARWRPVEPPAAVVRMAPVRFGRRSQDIGLHRLLPAFPEMGVLELPRAYLVGAHGWVVTRDRYMLPGLSRFATGDEVPLDRRPVQVRRLRGTVASLATDYGFRNYGHFLYEGLPRLELLRKAGVATSDVDWFYCGFPGPKSLKLLDRAGIPLERIVPAEPGVAVRADLVLATSFPGARFDHPRWVVDFLRRELLPEGAPREQRRRLYVRRTSSRRIVNEAEVQLVLEAHGFETYDPMLDDEPPATFAKAEAVVGVHGANLADICFCPNGAKVLELTPSDHVHPYWYAQAGVAGLEHAYIVCESTARRAPGAARGGDADIVVDTGELREALDGMGLAIG